MSEVIRRNKALGVSLESEPGVQGRVTYTVTAGGEAADLTPTTVLALAEAVYRERCEERAAPARERLARETASRDISAIRSGSAGRRAQASRRSGGQGGRGGV